MCDNVKKLTLYSVATDPIYIGTGGYTIGRVDNTIVRDPITKIPKIPGSSIAGTWRYYVALELQSYFKDEYKTDLSKRSEKKDKIEELFNKPKDWMKNYSDNRFARIKCAGQDDLPQKTYKEMEDEKSGHCGHCIVCKSFGFSKKDLSWQGMLFFSDLNILFFPVYTRLGVKWITSERILKDAGLFDGKIDDTNIEIVYVQEKIEDDKIKGYINLGWLNLPYQIKTVGAIHELPQIDNFSINKKDIIIVPDSLISQIINSNLEVRTSVSIDPITGAAKEGALFTSEAIPRGTVFYGNIRIFDKSAFNGIVGAIHELPLHGNLPDAKLIKSALCNSKKYYETLGIGGMTTRGFGRMKLELVEDSNSACQENETSSTSSGEEENNE